MCGAAPAPSGCSWSRRAHGAWVWTGAPGAGPREFSARPPGRAPDSGLRLNTHRRLFLPGVSARRRAPPGPARTVDVYAPARPLVPQGRTGTERPDAAGPVPAQVTAWAENRNAAPKGITGSSAPPPPAGASNICTLQQKYDRLLANNQHDVVSKESGNFRVSKRTAPDGRYPRKPHPVFSKCLFCLCVGREARGSSVREGTRRCDRGVWPRRRIQAGRSGAVRCAAGSHNRGCARAPSKRRSHPRLHLIRWLPYPAPAAECKFYAACWGQWLRCPEMNGAP